MLFLNFFAVVGIVAQCVKYLGKGKMRKVFHDFLRRCPKLPPFNNGAYRRSCAFDNRLSSEDFLSADNMWMFRSYYHFNNSILPYSLNHILSIFYDFCSREQDGVRLANVHLPLSDARCSMSSVRGLRLILIILIYCICISLYIRIKRGWNF